MVLAWLKENDLAPGDTAKPWNGEEQRLTEQLDISMPVPGQEPGFGGY